MKKVLLLSLGLVMGLGAFAQEKAVKPILAPGKVSINQETLGTDVVKGNANTAVYPFRAVQAGGTVVNEFYAEAEGMYSVYDLQSNGFISNRMYQAKNGSVAITATMSIDEYDVNQTDRGTGYNFILNGQIDNCGDVPTYRMEANATGEDLRTGWPTVAPYGETGEILVNHSEGLKYWTREVAGQGVWDGPHDIPNPVGLEGQNGVDYQLSWPRIVTTGENNDVVHIIACAQNADVEKGYVANFYLRSTDLQNWDIQWSPLVMDDMHLDTYSADDYAVSANGDNIAVVYCGGFSTHVMLYESNDAGLTWTSRIVWECPIHGLDWETDEESIFDNLYGPVHASVAIGVDGVSHVALSVGCYKHDELGTSYNLYYGLNIDGIAYWNDTTCWDVDENGVGVPSPIRSNFDDSPLNALRLWWPVPEDTNYIQRDIYNFCAWMPTPEEVGGLGGMDYTKIYTGSAGGGEAGDYLVLLGGCSAYPSIAVDPAGNLAVAFSAPDPLRLYAETYYLRNIFSTYRDADSLYWNSAYTGEFYNFYHEFQHTADEATYVSAVSAPVHENEFWFSCYSDDIPGFYFGNYHSQATSNVGTVNVFKYSPVGAISDESESIGLNETQDVVYNIFPNPASDFIKVTSSSDANAVVTFSNIAGQTVKVVNQNLTSGENTIAISDLNTGVYFCTVTANGYSHTTKVIVK